MFAERSLILPLPFSGRPHYWHGRRIGGIPYSDQIYLEEKGYRVFATVDGEQALTEYHAHQAHIDLMIADVIMPKRNDKEVYDRISGTNPDLKTIFISSYTANIVERKKLPGNCHLVTKPFAPEELLKKIRAVLDENT